MTDQLIIEPEARLLVELGQERGVVYEDELAGLSLELDLDADDVQTLRDELAQLGVDIVEPPAPEERIEVVEVEIATTNSLDLFLRQAEAALKFCSGGTPAVTFAQALRATEIADAVLAAAPSRALWSPRNISKT